MVSIKDVAKHAGVSVATVSRVLSKQNNVRDETRALVMQSIQELNYSPNIIAQQLRQQKTNLINVLVPNITNPFYHKIFLGIQKIARENNFQVHIVDCNNDSSVEEHCIDALARKQVDGIISLAATATIENIENIANGSPIVLACQYFEASPLPTISIDNVAASQDAVQYLISLGHTKIAYLSASLNPLLYRDRFTGYICALNENKIHIDMQKVSCEGDSSLYQGYISTKHLLQTASFSAICAAGDNLAIGAIKAIQEAGLRIPEDISIIGFDDIAYASYTNPPLTTVQQPMYEIGQQAMLMLLNLINEETFIPSKKIMPHKIIVRSTVGPVIKNTYND